MRDSLSLKPVVWLGPTRDDVRDFPAAVRDHIGYALYVSQMGGKHADAKPLAGFGGAGVLEIVSDYRSDTFRAVYTLRYGGRVFVLHAFQKKSKSGRATPQREMDLIRKRLREAEQIARELEL